MDLLSALKPQMTRKRHTTTTASPFVKGPLPPPPKASKEVIRLELLPREDYRAENRYEDQDGGDLKGQQQEVKRTWEISAMLETVLER